MSEISAVTFDLWQTLIMDTPEQGRVRAQVRIDGAMAALAKAGKPYPQEQVLEAYNACRRACDAIRSEGRDLAFGRQVDTFIGCIEEGLPAQLTQAAIDEIAAAYCDAFFVYPPQVHEHAAEVLREVKAEGYKVGLLSNTGMTPGYAFRAFLEQQGLTPYFDVMAFSDEMLLSKPARLMFQRVLKDMGADPGETVHVGDHLRNDVLGARDAGLRTIWIETYGDGREPAQVTPDVTVSALGEVAGAVRFLAQNTAGTG